MGRSRYKITNSELPHFITLTVLHWIPVFTRPETVNILLESLTFLSKDDLKVYAYVVLEKMMRQKIDYIHLNPVKRGYVDEAEHWRYSSAKNYLGRQGLLEVCRQW